MSKIVEKRTVRIPPCKIDTTLVREIGELLENEEPCRDRLGYSLDTKTQDIESKRVNDFVEADWGASINKIGIETDYKYPRVKIKIDLRSSDLSEFSVSGRNATWVNGITDQVEHIFQKYKQNSHKVRTNPFIKLPLTISISAILIYPILLVFSPFIKPESLLEYYIALGFLLMMFIGTGIILLIDWLFPHYEYGETLQKRMRKWIWIVLFGSGLIPTIILKYLGL